MDIEKIAKAIEADAGMELDGLRESLMDMQQGKYARIHTPGQILARHVRAKTGLTQPKFAKKINTPVATLRDWEQGRSDPPGGVTCLLWLLDKHPELIAELENVYTNF